MKLISISLSPNTENDDVLLAIKTLFQPWKWQVGVANSQVSEWFYDYFSNPHVLLYNSGRSAQYEILKALKIGKGDEVIVQGFTCVAVPNSVIWNGATPVYCDVDDSLNLSVAKLEKLITKKTKAIIVQHTLGIPAEIDTIVSIAKKHQCLVIEDCAHSLGATYKGKKLGTWGDAAFFSFGRDKIVSSVFGGAGLISLAHEDTFQTLKLNHKKLDQPSVLWIAQQLFHPIAFSLILPLYLSGIGKLLLVLFQKCHLLSFPVYPEEKKGKNPGIFPAKYPNGLAILGFHQLKKLQRYNDMRKKVAELYTRVLHKKNTLTLQQSRDGAIYLRFSFFMKEPDILIRVMKEKGILIGNWYRHAIDPKDTDLAAAHYTQGDCPYAEELGKQVVNLPTRISLEHAQDIIGVIQSEV